METENNKKKENIKAKIAAYLIIMLVGVFLLSYSLTTIITYLHNYKTYPQVNGTIVGYSLGEHNEKNMIISYEVNGEEFKIQSTFKEEDNYPVGNLIVVRYNEKNPENYILGNETLNIGMVIIGAASCVFGLLGMLSVYTNNKKEKKDTKGEE